MAIHAATGLATSGTHAAVWRQSSRLAVSIRPIHDKISLRPLPSLARDLIMAMNPKRHSPLSRRLSLALILACVCSASPHDRDAEAPCDGPLAGGLDEPEVQVGFRHETRSDACLYIYTVVNRGPNKLTLIEVGYDADLDRCELTGAPPNAPPDTAYGPAGWESGPVQMKKDDPSFTVRWSPMLGSVGSTAVLPKSVVSGFAVALPRRDSLYEHCHWLIRFERFPRAAYVGIVRPESELDLPSTDTGTISGKIIDERGVGIAGANVFVWRTDLGARTNWDGSFTISKVPVGGQSVLVRATGFDPCEKAHLRITANATTPVDLRLPSIGRPTPCAPYVTAAARIELPFPGGIVDTAGARFLKRGIPVPPKVPRTNSQPQAFIYGLSSGEIDIVYPGVGLDTLRRAFVATVSRNVGSPEEERLVRIAEETYPPVQSILPIADSRHRDALSREERPWWYGTFDGVRLPYAVTMDGVRYYLELIQALARGDSTQTNGIRMKSASFSYHARVSSRYSTYSRDGRVFKDAYLVEMDLSWSDYCGSLCACGFHLNRTVVIRRDGTVLCVFGDQKPMVVVS